MIRQRFTAALILGLVTLALASPLHATDATALFKQKCAPCHGQAGKGDTPMGQKLAVRDLGSAAVQAQTDAALQGIITSGKNKMPAFNGKIPDADIKLLVAHIRTFKH